MKIFDSQPRKGIPVSHRIMFDGINRMAKALEKLSVHNGHVDWSNGIPTIVVDTGVNHSGEETGGLAFEKVVQCGKHVESDSWSTTNTTEYGAADEVTDYLAVPFDVTIAPYYVFALEADNPDGTESWEELETDWFPNAIDRETDDNDPRKNAEFYKISEHAGTQHVILT